MNDSGYGHDDISCMTYDIRVDILFGCVFCATIACGLRWGVTLVGDYHYWALLAQLWDPPFQVHEKTMLHRGHEYEEGRVVALRNIFCKNIL